MKLKILIWIISLLLLNNNGFSQNGFSQFFGAPLEINPSNTGRFLGDFRFGGIYRNQPERTSTSSRYSFFTDISFLSSKLTENDRMAIGISALGEKDDFNGIKNTNLLVSASYFKSLNEDGTEKLGAGFQIGFGQKRIAPPLLVFEDQMMAWFHNGFRGINPFERKIIDIRYLDLNVGLTYQKLINSINSLVIGISVMHINSPSRNDGDVVFSLLPELSFQFEFEKQVGTGNKVSFALIANDLTNKNTLNDYYVSCIYQTVINDSKYKLNMGCLYRKDYQFLSSIVPLIGIKYEHFNLNFSYDISVANQTTYKRGGLEAGLIFIGRHKTLKK